MNYLAHAYLSFDNPKIMVGNITGDEVKGNKFLDHPNGVREGLLLHRLIDTFTDQHPLTKQMGSFFKPQFGLYSGILTDIYCDHLLAKNFKQLTGKELSEFVIYVYKVLNDHYDLLPGNWKEKLYYMEKYNWLEGYQQLAEIKRVLLGMTQRHHLKVNLSLSIESYQNNADEIETLFLQFFKDIQLHLPTIYKEVTLRLAKLG